MWINANTPVACLDGDCRSADLLNPSSRSIAVSRSRQTSSVPNFSGNAMARAEETGGGAVDLPVEPAAVFAEAHARVGRGGIEAGEGRVSSTRDRGRTASHFAREVREVASRRRRIRRSTCGRRRLARWTRGTNSSVESSLTRGRGRHSLAGSSVCRCQAVIGSLPSSGSCSSQAAVRLIAATATVPVTLMAPEGLCRHAIACRTGDRAATGYRRCDLCTE